MSRTRVVLAVAVALVAAPSAHALTRKQADAAALAVFKPQNVRTRTGVVVYGLPRPLHKGQAVFELGRYRGSHPFKFDVNGLDRRAWLYWEDPTWGARFTHLTFQLLIDDHTGKVLDRRALSYWPVIDGKDAPFAGNGRFDSRYQVFSDVPGGSTTPRGATSLAEGAAAGFAFAPRQLNGMAIAAPRGSLNGECVITIGRRDDPQFAPDFAGLREVTAALDGAGTGLQAFRARSSGYEDPDGGDLADDVGSMVATAGCKDILVYIDGHGAAPPGPPLINVGVRWKKIRDNPDGTVQLEGFPAYVTARDLRRMLRKYKDTTFKFKFDSCYAGRMAEAVSKKEFPNVHVVENSSSRTETSYSYLSAVKYRNGRVVKNPTDNPGNTLIDDPEHPGQKIPDVKKGRGEFTNGNVAALRKFFTTPTLVNNAIAAGGSLLAQALTYAAKHEKEQDFAAQVGMTHPGYESDQPPFSENPPAGGGGTPPGATVTGGSTLQPGADAVEQSQQDEDFWPAFYAYCKLHPADPLCQTSRRRDAAGSQATMPADGQILAIRLKGKALPSGTNGDPGPLTQIHFSALRPQPDGSVKVIVTSQAFDLPSTGDPNQISTFVPENFCVAKGDILTFSTEGGFDPVYYPNGVPFEVFGHVTGSQTNYYTQHNGVMNGAQFSGGAIADTELLMQWDLGTGSHATALCPGGTATRR